MTETKILVARQNGIVQIRVLGRATFKVSRELRDFAVKVLDEGCRSVIVDLSSCDGMDSTFMGILAMVALRGRKQADLLLVNVSAEHRALLDGIGVSRLWRFVDRPVPDVSWQSLCEAAAGTMNMANVGETVLSAHRTLMELDPENVPRFQDVVDLLGAEIGAKKKSGAG